MKTSRIIILILTFVARVLTVPTAAQKSAPGVAVPKYDRVAKVTFKGTVEEVRPSVPSERRFGLASDFAVVPQHHD